MQTKELIGLILALIAVTGGLVIGIVTVRLSLMNDLKSKIADIEARNKERLALIEKGMDPSLAFTTSQIGKNKPLLWGLLFTGVGLAVFCGYFLSMKTGLKENIVIYSLAMLFGGISLVIYYYLNAKRSGVKKTN